MKTGRGKTERIQPSLLDATFLWKADLADYGTAIAWSPDGSPDGTFLGVTSAAGEVVLYTTADATVHATGGGSGEERSQEPQTILLRQADGQAVSTLGFSADGRFLAAAGQTGTVWLWDLQQVMAGSVEVFAQQSHGSAWIDSLSWHPQKPWLAYGVGDQAMLWQVAEPTQNNSTQNGPAQNDSARNDPRQDDPALLTLDFQDSSILHLAWHPQGQFLSASGHGGLKVWDSANWKQAPQKIAVPGASLYAAWSADGRYLASGNLDRTLTVVEWDSPPPWLMQGFPGKVRQVAWSSSAAISGSSAGSSTGAPLLAAACAEGITLWERAGREWKSRVLQQPGRVVAIAFQPQSQLLASASQAGQVSLWQGEQRLAQTLKGFTAGVSCLAWRPGDESMTSAAAGVIAAAGTAGEVRVWRVATRRAKGFG